MTTLKDIIRDAIIEAAEQQRLYSEDVHTDKEEGVEAENIMKIEGYNDNGEVILDSILDDAMDQIKRMVGIDND